MPRVPFIGRLHVREYLALLVSLVLIFLEIAIRIITLMLPTPIINFFYRSSRRLFNSLSSPQGRKSRNRKKAIVNSIAQASDFVELCEIFGYYAEEHVVQTRDGFLLGLHRLGWRKGEEDKRVNSGEGSIAKKVVYLHHGLLMNSEVWVCLTEKERCLPFLLVEKGYDVWLGNNRGNKYSKKSVHCAPTEIRFWDFSIDQFAFHDIPDSIDYILSTTRQPSLSYIGFSQGTAQAFATLSIHPTLNDKVDVFIALAPAMSPKGLTSGIVDSLVKASPEILFLAFGRRAILGSATMWQAILYPPIFVRLIDMSIGFLFGWKCQNISVHQKLAAYPHLYSFTSTKSVVHWFQIIRNGTFQMYDDEVQAPLSITNGVKYYKVAKFPTRNIKTPIVLVYGGSDSLVDINVMLKELPKHTTAKEIPHYEHLDFLWACDVDTLVFPHVFDALSTYAHPYAAGKAAPNYVFHPLAAGMNAQPFSDDDVECCTPSDRARKVSETTSKALVHRRFSSPHASSPSPRTLQPPIQFPSARAEVSAHPGPGSAPAPAQPPKAFPPHPAFSPHPSASAATEKTSTSRPEGWWSSDEVGETGNSSPAKSPSLSFDAGKGSTRASGLELSKSPSRASLVSNGSVKSLGRIGERGISLGTGRAVGGIVSGEAMAVRDKERKVSGAGTTPGEESTGMGDEGKRRKGRKKRTD